VICNYKKWGENFRKPGVIVSWNVKFQKSIEWKSEVTNYPFSNNSDEEDEESQDQPHYHILMVDSDESNPQFQLIVPEGNQLCVSGPLRINIK
jgi:heat shock protein HspQ